MAIDQALVDRALAEATKRAENLDYFFDHLSSAEWIEPLRERGFFSEPPEQFIDDQGYVRAPDWSESQYLARVAGAAPELVLEVIENIETNNVRVQADFVDAALAMPVEQSTRFASQLVGWISKGEALYYSLAQKTAELVCRLFTGDATERALELFPKRG